MGRYYDGDISGKFWFGVQSSDAANRFGVYGEVDEDMEELYGDDCTPLSYSFEEEHLPMVIEEIELIEKELDNNKDMLDKFFEDKNSYNSDMIIEFFKENDIEITSDDVADMLSEYADLELGYKIKECLEETGYCGFEAEVY
jgi:hypothetical protein